MKRWNQLYRESCITVSWSGARNLVDYSCLEYGVSSHRKSLLNRLFLRVWGPLPLYHRATKY